MHIIPNIIYMGYNNSLVVQWTGKFHEKNNHNNKHFNKTQNYISSN